MTFTELIALKASYLYELDHVDAALTIREEDVERLRRQKAEIEQRLIEIERMINDSNANHEE